MTDPRQLLIGTGLFSFVEGTERPPDDDAYNDTDFQFGNVKAFTFQTQSETKDHFGSYGGVKILDRVHTTMLRLGYTLQLEQMHELGVRALFFGGADEPGIYNNWPYRKLTPLAAPRGRSGYGRLEIWDPAVPAVPRLVHLHFFCNLRLNNQPELADDWFGYEIKVDVLSPVGEVFYRNPSDPV